MKKLFILILMGCLVTTVTYAQSSTITPTVVNSPYIQSSTLIGTGTRPVYAASNGVLTTNYTAPSSSKIDTSYYSVPAAEFRRSQGGNILFSNGEVSGAFGSNDTLIAPVNLPHGAVIKKFTFCYKDNAGNTGMQAQLMNTTVNSPNRSVSINAALLSSTVAGGNNYGCKDAPAILIPNVGNNKNSYWIRVIPQADGGGNDYDTWVAGGGLRIVHFLIEYTITH